MNLEEQRKDDNNLCETHLGCLRERSFIMSQREVGLGEEGRFLKMYKMWEDC